MKKISIYSLLFFSFCILNSVYGMEIEEVADDNKAIAPEQQVAVLVNQLTDSYNKLVTLLNPVTAHPSSTIPALAGNIPTCKQAIDELKKQLDHMSAAKDVKHHGIIWEIRTVLDYVDEQLSTVQTLLKNATSGTTDVTKLIIEAVGKSYEAKSTLTKLFGIFVNKPYKPINSNLFATIKNRLLQAPWEALPTLWHGIKKQFANDQLCNSCRNVLHSQHLLCASCQDTIHQHIPAGNQLLMFPGIIPSQQGKWYESADQTVQQWFGWGDTMISHYIIHCGGIDCVLDHLAYRLCSHDGDTEENHNNAYIISVVRWLAKVTDVCAKLGSIVTKIPEDSLSAESIFDILAAPSSRLVSVAEGVVGAANNQDEGVVAGAKRWIGGSLQTGLTYLAGEKNVDTLRKGAEREVTTSEAVAMVQEFIARYQLYPYIETVKAVVKNRKTDIDAYLVPSFVYFKEHQQDFEALHNRLQIWETDLANNNRQNVVKRNTELVTYLENLGRAWVESDPTLISSTSTNRSSTSHRGSQEPILNAPPVKSILAGGSRISRISSTQEKKGLQNSGLKMLTQGE